jgi:hypothetical protein
MKNLDVDIVSTYFRAYDACQVRIEFTGGYPIGKSQGNNPCQVTVPYCSFSKKLQTIQRLGGKIVSVSILEGKLASAHTSSTVVEIEAIAPELIRFPSLNPDVLTSRVENFIGRFEEQEWRDGNESQ